MPRHYDEDEDDLYENPYADSDTDDDDEDVEVYENPASVVRTARDERLWRMAKASAARQGRAREWPYVMGIFQRMKHREGGATMNPGGSEMVIAYSAQPSLGAWYPVVKANGRVVSTFEPYLIYEKEVALAIALDFAREFAQSYVGGGWNVSIVAENPDDGDDGDGEEAAPPPPAPPTFQLRASAVQQPLFGAAAFESVPKPKKKLPPPVDTRQRDLFGLPIDDDKPRKNPGMPVFAVKTNFPDADLWVVRRGTPEKVGSVTKTFSPEHVGVQVLAPDLILPDYLYYVLMQLHSQGFYRERMKGATRLQGITTNDVKDALRLLRFG